MSRIFQPIDANPVRRQRWFPCRNNSGDTTIPGFALIRIAGITRVDGQAAYAGNRPIQVDVDAQNPALLAAAGPSPIPPGRIGWATQDWPAQVLHDDPGSIVFGDSCGPQLDSFFASADGSAFRALSTDTGVLDDDDFGVVWIAPGESATKPYITMFGDDTAQGGDEFDLGDAAIESTDETVIRPETGVKTESGIEFAKLEVKAGVYRVAVSGTMYGVSAPRGSTLQAQIAIDGAVVNQLTVRRTQDLEEDQYGNDIHRSQENVSVKARISVVDSLSDPGGWHDLTLKNTTSLNIVLDLLTVDVEKV